MIPELLKNNFLEGPALTLVKNLDDVDDIWDRLKAAFGDSKVMLDNKLSQLNNIDGLWKHKNPSKVVEGLSKLTNTMRDLMTLAERHRIENKLYYGDATDRIYKLCGNERMTRWFTIQCDRNYEGELLWLNFIKFLEKDIKVYQQKALLEGVTPEKKQALETKEKGNKQCHTTETLKTDLNKKDTDKTSLVCNFCGKDDHFAINGRNGSKLIQYFACKKFVELSPQARFAELRKKGFCCQCLFPGAKYLSGIHKAGKCQNEFVCPHPAHNKYTTKIHVLLCDEHKDYKENHDLLELYKQRYILKLEDLPAYSKNITLNYHSTGANIQFSDKHSFNSEGEIHCDEKAIYMLQTIEVDSKQFSVFYDSGCGDFVATHDAVMRIGNRAKQEYKGPIRVGGVGGIVSESQHGIYSVKLPLANGKEAVMTGICLDRITEDFPFYPLTGKVEEDIRKSFKKNRKEYGRTS